MRWALVLVLAACGDRPALQNVPHPDTSTAAGVAAAAAAAATLADPNANRTPEKKTPQKSDRPVANHETVPSDVLDRLESKPEPETDAEPDAEPDDDAPVDTTDAPPLPPPVVREP